MAFIVESGNTISFAEYDDVLSRDSRVIENNEALTDDVVEEQLIRATERVLSKIRVSQWWVDYYRNISGVTISSAADIPAPTAGKIKSSTNDFTDLCVYTALAEFILPKVADFGNPDDAERAKMGYYANKAEQLFLELITIGDWYDFDNDNTISSSEKQIGRINLKRVR
jgi:hypothetical protein|tara:strand:- start:10885 stop:11391 length:507 start_codon:yes stop_codon:yes gene_type:complete